MDKFSFKGNIVFTAFWIFLFVPIIMVQWWAVNTVFLSTMLSLPIQEQVILWITIVGLDSYLVALTIRNVLPGV